MSPHFLTIAIALGAALCFGAADRVAPNVLLITADDLSWDSLGCTGNPLPGITPNLDRLASQGLLVENGHVVTTVCGPSREALYTGLYPQRNGYMGHGVQPPKWWKRQADSVKPASITTLLHDAGYLTGLVGKHGSTHCKFSMRPASSHVDTGMGRDPAKYHKFVREFFDRAKREDKPFYLAANAHDPHRYWARHHDETDRWIRQAMGDKVWTPLANGKPYPDPITHFQGSDCPTPAPYPDEPRFKDALAPYYNSVNRMDQVVGEALRALDESGQADNTIVLFLSDHGLAWDLSKWSLYPSGTKTPIIVRWPGQVQAGKRDSESVISTVDIAPTLADACGLSLTPVDGSSFLSLLRGTGPQWTRTEAFSCFNYMNNDAKRDESIAAYTPELPDQFDQYRPARALTSTRFVYIWNAWADGSRVLPRTMLGEFSGFLRASKNPADADRLAFIERRTSEELYDLSSDPGCLENLIHRGAHSSTRENFRKKMQAKLQATQDHELGSYQRFLGTGAE